MFPGKMEDFLLIRYSIIRLLSAIPERRGSDAEHTDYRGISRSARPCCRAGPRKGVKRPLTPGENAERFSVFPDRHRCMKTVGRFLSCEENSDPRKKAACNPEKMLYITKSGSDYLTGFGRVFRSSEKVSHRTVSVIHVHNK